MTTMNKDEEKRLIEEYLRTRTERADKDVSPANVDDAAPLPDLPFDKPSTTGHEVRKEVR